MRSTLQQALVVSVLVGCSAARSHDAPIVKTPIRPLFLWRVIPPGAATTEASYLFGTCHVGVTLDRALPADQRGALDHARVVALEVDLTHPADPERIAGRMLLPEGQSLRALIGEASWRQLVTREPFSRMPWLLIDRLHPIMVDSLLALASAGAAPRPGTPAAVGMDESVAQAARAQGTRITGLETIDEQLSMIQGVPASRFVASVQQELRTPTEAGRAMRGLLQTCAMGDDTTLLRFMVGVPDALLAPRNAAWLPRIEAMVHEGGAFVAVGAGHLVGPGGLVASLQAQGYRIERLSTRAEDDPGDAAVGASGSEAPSNAPPGPVPGVEPSGEGGRSSEAPSAAPPPPTASEPTGRPRDEWLADFASTFATQMCALPIARDCLQATESACVAQYDRAARVCAEQLGATLPPRINAASGSEIGGRLGECAQQGLEALERMRGIWAQMPRCGDPAAWNAALEPPVAPAPPRSRPARPHR